jgi:hypothetical protein
MSKVRLVVARTTTMRISDAFHPFSSSMSFKPNRYLKTAAAVARRCFEDTRTLPNCNEFVGQVFASDTLVAEKTACFLVLSSQRLESPYGFFK